MALSDNSNEKEKKRPYRALDAAKARWSDQQKLDAAKSWLVLGNTSMVARLHSIPRITLCKWQECQWWHDLIAELRAEEKITLSAKMKNLVDAAHQVVANRLEVGDAVLNQKTGQIVYKPVSMKDAHRVAVDMLNQKNVLDKVTTDPEVKEADSNKLAALAERFAEFATQSIEKKLDKKRTVDVEDVYEVEVAQDDPVSNTILLDNQPGAVAPLVEEEQERTSSN